MRVTQNQITSQYLNGSNTALENMQRINAKVLSQRSFNKASEDPVGAAHAMVIRNNMSNIEMYKSNITTGNGIMSSGEKALLSISKISAEVTDKLIEALNADKQGPDEKAILANQLSNLGDQMLSQINSKFGDRYLFGGSNNEKTPYVYDKTTGELKYNGTEISTNNDSTAFSESKSLLADIGLGIKFNDDGTVDPQTAMDLSLNGAEYLGCGKDADGDSKNMIDLTFKASKAVKDGDYKTAATYLDKINTAKSQMLIGITNIGTKQQTLDYSQSRIEDDEITLATQQKAVEGADVAKEISNLKVAEMAYNATLAMGSKIVPNSIFNFIN